MDDSRFSRHGVVWQRQWVGDNAGRYEWTAEGMTAWRDGWDYRVAVDGIELPRQLRKLTEAMDAGTLKLMKGEAA